MRDRRVDRAPSNRFDTHGLVVFGLAAMQLREVVASQQLLADGTRRGKLTDPSTT